MLGLPDAVTACLFDLDGVLTDTASVHTKAWKQMFDAVLADRDQPPFDPEGDYQQYVDGKPREDGVRDFLASRGIHLPDGHEDDPVTADTVHGLGNRKNELFQEVLHRDGVEVFEGSRRYLQAVRDAGLAVAVVSSSANTKDVLQLTGLEQYVQARVDGVTLREEHLRGKPAPDSFLRGAQLLGADASSSAVFEDATSGVAAGRAGGFVAVVGVDRVHHRQALLDHGATVVVEDLDELLGGAS